MNHPFIHRHSAHCESGVLSGLLRNGGLDLSETMTFGIGAGLFFIYFPFIKMGGIPFASYRSEPGGIIKNVCKRLSVTLRMKRFGNQAEGMAELDKLLDKGIPVGLQTGVFWLPYFPKNMRFQFNGHNLTAYGKEGNNYLISDPVFEFPVTCPAEDLQRARFSKGLLAPKGLLYYLEDVPAAPDLTKPVRSAIIQVCRRMLSVPLPFFGVRGIRYLAKSIERWPQKLTRDEALLQVGSIIRLQEEIGTGGAGFRFMYTTFLQEASAALHLPGLGEAAVMLSETGDLWRQFAVKGAQLCKGHDTREEIFGEMAGIIRDCANREEKVFVMLKKAIG
jgi:hypothetical protein